MKRDQTFKIFRSVVVVVAFLWLASCNKMESNYQEFVKEGAPVYTGKIDSLAVFAGKNRVKLTWALLSDPSITGCKISWMRPDGTADSTVVAVSKTSGLAQLETIVDELPEGAYDFYVSSYNDNGHSSVRSRIGVRVFGDTYRSGKLNRATQSFLLMHNKSLMTSWYAPDTVNVVTEVKYTDTLGQTNAVYLYPDSTTIILPGWQQGTAIYTRSSYKPVSNAIDTFTVPYYDTVEVLNLVTSLLVNKSLWRQVSLPGDANVNAFGTSLSSIWDGVVASHPNNYHSDGASLPHTFTIDMGEVYHNLIEFEEWGRQGGAFHNPVEFEVWGIADITDAATVLNPTDPGWKDESIAKGWTLLAEVNRTDDGAAGLKVDLVPGAPPVRYVRIRVLRTIDNTNYSHMSEISFWYQP